MTPDRNNFDVIIIGAGAAGFMAAIEAGKRGRKVLLVDHSKFIGEKIRISGGGRCNFTNTEASPENYISENPHFCKSALSQFSPQDFIDLMDKYGIGYHEKKLGQLFCDTSSQAVLDLLFTEAQKANVMVYAETKVLELKQLDASSSEAQSEKGDLYRFKLKLVSVGIEEQKCKSLVIATGGLSIPKMGATAWGHEQAKKFGHKITVVAPALVPFEFDDKSFFESLAGTAVDTVTSCNGQSFRENILFTHKGLSGPAILQISSYWRKGDALTINFAPDVDLGILLELKKYFYLKGKSRFVSKESSETLAKLSDKYKVASETLASINAKQQVKSIMAALVPDLPKKLLDACTEYHKLDKVLLEYSDKDLENLIQSFNAWEVTPSKTEGFAKAEVTRGGVDTADISSKTMESKLVPGLYFCGEVMDVTGWLGGYNFQWAWASGYVVGQNC